MHRKKNASSTRRTLGETPSIIHKEKLEFNFFNIHSDLTKSFNKYKLKIYDFISHGICPICFLGILNVVNRVGAIYIIYPQCNGRDWGSLLEKRSVCLGIG